MDKLVSVIIPVYKVEKYLDECVLSVVNQTHKNLEIILVDDGSPDNCPELCDKWAASDSRITVIHKENGGLSSARNAGLDRARGDYIVFLDSDDFVSLQFYEKALSVLEKDNSDLCACAFRRIDEKGNLLEEKSCAERTLDRKEALSELFSGDLGDYVCNKFFKASLFETVRFPEKKAFEDIGTTYRVFLLCDKISTFPDALYSYRKREGSIVSKMTEKTLCDLFSLRKKRYLDMLEIYPDVAEKGFELTALSAKRLLDRSLWEQTDADSVNEARRFVCENREKILACKNRELTFFVAHPTLYRIFRIVKHRLGAVAKKVLK